MLLDLEKMGIVTSTTYQIWYKPENPAQKNAENFRFWQKEPPLYVTSPSD